jgi:hypothetical protein
MWRAVVALVLLGAGLAPGWVAPSPAAAAAPAGPVTTAATTATATAPSAAYWMAGADGSVFAFGAPALGSMAGRRLVQPVVGMAGSPTGLGYWLVAADGAIFAFGDARFFGSTGGRRLNRPVVGMATTPTGGGYWLVADDGGVFAYGDARFFGSTGGITLNRPIVGMATTPTGRGYWLVADDGGVFAYGDARFFGSTGGIRLNRPVVAVAAAPAGGGYWLVADDGGIFAFGSARFFGSTGGIPLNRPIVDMAASPSSGGYTLVATDGGVFTFGDARFAGSAGGQRLAAPIVGMAVDLAPRFYVRGQRGYDISWPQCGRAYPSRPFDIAVVGVNGGRALTTNPCFVDQATRWASPDQLDVYLNLNKPSAAYTGGCPPADKACIAVALGRDAVRSSIATVRAAGLGPRVWWLDIEMPELWDTDTRFNALSIQSAIDELQANALNAGIYSTRYQWNLITGSYTTRTPLLLWAAGSLPLQRCNEPWGGGHVVLSQVLGIYTSTGFDENHAC